METSKSIRLHLADGSPGGLLIAEIMNWTGSLIAASRSDLAEVLARNETNRTGIYILIGDDPDKVGGQSDYIGESDDIAGRLRKHARPESTGGKDFWDRVVVVTSTDTNLTKAHARYLESRFIELASQAQRANLANSQTPPQPPLPEFDRSAMEYFLDQAAIVLPLLGVNILRSTNPPSSHPRDPEPLGSPIFEAHLSKEGVHAKAQEIDGEFIVRTNSLARSQWVGDHDHGYWHLRKKLEEDGTLVVVDGGNRRFARDYAFNSPSAAAAVIFGRRANGRYEWRDPDTGLTFGEWQSRAVTL